MSSACSPAASPLLLITRPGEPGRVLTDALRALGHDALWWPAFDLLAPADPAPLARCLEQLEQYPLAVFVSPAAVQAFAAALGGARWPAGTMLAGVGRATLDSAIALLPGAAAAAPLAPAGTAAADGGSEALWAVLQALPALPARVLIVRAQSGRDWLAQQLRNRGVAVDEVAAYQRQPHRPAEPNGAALRAALDQGRPLAVLFSSTEAVAAMNAALAAQAERSAWLPASYALAVHPRIAQALRAAGWPTVLDCEPGAGSIDAALRGAGAAPAGAVTCTAGQPPTGPARIS